MGATVIEDGECTARELIAELKNGERIVVRTEFLGAVHDLTLRWDGETFYCDTPTRLHKHETEAEMLSCIERYGYCSSA